MTDQLLNDPEATAGRIAVHTYLKAQLSTEEPREVKLLAVSAGARVHRLTAISALNWLIERGFVVQHPRGDRGVMRLTLAREAKSA